MWGPTWGSCPVHDDDDYMSQPSSSLEPPAINNNMAKKHKIVKKQKGEDGTKKKVDALCKFFLRGSCKYNNHCKFTHAIILKEQPKYGGRAKKGLFKGWKIAL